MPFQITTTWIANQAESPSFVEFLNTSDPSILSGFPECAGKTPYEVYFDHINLLKSKPGFVNTVRSREGVAETVVTTWDTKEHFEEASGIVPEPAVIVVNTPSELYNDGTAQAHLRVVYASQYLSNITVNYAEI